MQKRLLIRKLDQCLLKMRLSMLRLAALNQIFYQYGNLQFANKLRNDILSLEQKLLEESLTMGNITSGTVSHPPFH